MSFESFDFFQRMVSRLTLQECHQLKLALEYKITTDPHKPNDEEKRVWDKGDKIGAIKLLRHRTNLGLKEAKDVMEAYGQGR